MQNEFGLEVAHRISCADSDDWPKYFEQLRRGRQLHRAIQQINTLLSEPEHRQVAIDALRRIGLWHDGHGTNA